MLAGISLSQCIVCAMVLGVLGSWEEVIHNSADAEETMSCDNLWAGVPFHSETLPSEIPELNCTCSGMSKKQACPKWSFINGFESVTIVLNVTRREKISCTAHLKFSLRPEVLSKSNSSLLNLRCGALGQKRDSALLVKKSHDEARCKIDEDCLLPNQKCEVRGTCLDGDCPRTCHCVDPTPIFVRTSQETCYGSSAFGESCSFDVQCQYNRSSRYTCVKKDTNTNISRTGLCECFDGYEFDSSNQLCLLIVPEPPHQTITERIIIAVCCGIIGICIFLFVSYLCRRKCSRNAARRQSANDFSQGQDTTLPLNVPVDTNQEKPPPYQESEKGDTQATVLKEETENSSPPSPTVNITVTDNLEDKEEPNKLTKSEESPL